MLGCGVVEVKKYVRVKDCSDSCNFYFPGAFTPNNDNLNDRFTWYSNCDPLEFELVIYDRFGKKVFVTTDPHNSWDGGKTDNSASSEIYIYQAQYRLPYQSKQSLTGKIILLR
jgi:gliding motility-associated-like protein